MRTPVTMLLTAAFAASCLVGCGRPDNEVVQLAEGEGHEAHEVHQEGVLRMSMAQRAALGIVTTPAALRAVSATLTAPGEVRTNAYRSSLVTPRITAQIVARHARLGDAVIEGQPLVTLSSVAMAEAQGALIEADREWQRVRGLGRDVVSEARYVSAQVSRQRSYASVAAYGMTDAQIERLLQSEDASRAMGGFDLLSPQAGTVIRDEFVVGELIEPGRVLFELSDESVLWVQAQLSSVDVARVKPGTTARVSRDGTRWLEGIVVQLQHQLDERTRTQGVRIEIENRDDELHPGDYVEVVLATAATGGPEIAVPSDAIVLMGGSSAVFKLEGDEVLTQPVEVGAASAGWTEITAGLAVGDEVVTQDAFLVKSLLLKSQIGDEH